MSLSVAFFFLPSTQKPNQKGKKEKRNPDHLNPMKKKIKKIKRKTPTTEPKIRKEKIKKEKRKTPETEPRRKKKKKR